jgi:putative peptidoglycan lipid II flippase
VTGGHPRRGGRSAFLVAAGILASRVAGLVRERVFAHYLGNSPAAAAFKAALRIPNALQNLLGEGVLSASFIPVYAGLLGRQARLEADRVASAVFAVLTLAVAVLVALGLLLAPVLVDVVTPGFRGETRVLVIQLVRILFPGTGCLVLSAWCLGVLNSHRRFLLAYVAPVVWNLAIIAALVGWGGRAEPSRLVVQVAYGAVLGSALQCLVQAPVVRALLIEFRPRLTLADRQVRRVFRNLGPVVLGRGVVQVSAYVDLAYASLISERAVAALSYAQALYLLPVSLFGMAVSAAELPELARVGSPEAGGADELRARMRAGLERIAFFVVPSAAALAVLGDVVAGAVLQTGRFTAADTRYVWLLLAGAAVGLAAGTMARLYSSAFYARHDPRTPLWAAAIRVGTGAVLAYGAALWLPPRLGVSRDVGAAGLTLATGLTAWLELVLLRRRLGAAIGPVAVARALLARLWASAAVAAAVGVAVKLVLLRLLGAAAPIAAGAGPALWDQPAWPPILTALVVLVPYGLAFVTTARALGVPLARSLVAGAVRRLGPAAARRR